MLSASIAAIALPVGSAQAVDQKKARDKMIDLNKQALLSYEAKDFVTARDLLTKALKEAKVAGLEEDKMTARTYLHLGAVYWVGFQDQPVALQNFSLSKKIRPDIQLTPSIETPDLKAVFDMATVEAEPASSPAHVRPPPRPSAPAEPSGPQLMGDQGGEPDLPTSMAFPLMCTVPDVVPPHKALTMRCALKPSLRAKTVQIHYRTPGVEAYQALTMRKTAKGWYIVTLPSSVMKAGSLQVYFDARDAADNELATNGQIDSPSVIEVRKRGALAGAEGECPADDPMCRIRRQARADKYEAGLHRRREGAFWVGVGGGGGWGFVPAGNLEWEKNVKVSAMTTTTGLFHVVPEIGYMWSEKFGIALQGRIEYIRQQQATYIDPNSKERVQLAGSLTGGPTTLAPAAFLRAIWYSDLSGDGNFQLSFSGDLGGGFVRFPVKPVAVVNYDSVKDEYVPDWSKTIAKTDTRPVGPILGGASVGLIWHLSRYFALTFDARVLTGLPNFGAVVEGALSGQLAFGGAKGPAVVEEESEEGEAELDESALLDEPPTSDLGYEDEEE
ncbi:MAG: tetratricopeptide repeat protein [Deltaproteobacteria bacterium]|nr:tetratricopeptide repeat protein [Deltaproteobacteria bacterium]